MENNQDNLNILKGVKSKDKDNRKKLPKGMKVPDICKPKENAKYIDDPDQYFDLLGETTESKKFELFVHQLEPKEMPQLSNQFWNDEFPKLDFYENVLKGISLQMLKEVAI